MYRARASVEERQRTSRSSIMCDDDVVAKVAFERERFHREPRGEGVQRGEKHVRRSGSPTGGGGAARGRYRRFLRVRL